MKLVLLAVIVAGIAIQACIAKSIPESQIEVQAQTTDIRPSPIDILAPLELNVDLDFEGLLGSLESRQEESLDSDKATLKREKRFFKKKSKSKSKSSKSYKKSKKC